MLKIAITGGIGSGKSTVTEYLINRGFTVVDADKMARQMTEPEGKAIPYIIDNFGLEYIKDDGSMDRAKMRDLIFRDPEKKALLENGTTQVVIEDIRRIIKEGEEAGDKMMFFDLPLLFEKNVQNDYDCVWLITADRDIRKQRVKKRDNITDTIVELIIGSQTEEDDKIKNSDEVIYNNSSISNLYIEVDSLLDKYEIR